MTNPITVCKTKKWPPWDVIRNSMDTEFVNHPWYKIWEKPADGGVRDKGKGREEPLVIATEVCIPASVDTEPVDVRMEDRDSGQGKTACGHTESCAVDALSTRGRNKSQRWSKSVKSAATVDSDDGTVATSSAHINDQSPAHKGFHAAPDGARCLRCTNSGRPCLVKKGRACWWCHHAKTGCSLSNQGHSCSRAPPCH